MVGAKKNLLEAPKYLSHGQKFTFQQDKHINMQLKLHWNGSGQNMFKD